jgi:hypothetical protein
VNFFSLADDFIHSFNGFKAIADKAVATTIGFTSR